MNFRYEFHEEVEHDSIEAYTWYEARKAGLGDRFLVAVRRKMEQIIQNPEAYGVKLKKSYREAKVDVFPYLIVYKIYKQQKVIVVNSIHHAKRHPRKKYRK